MSEAQELAKMLLRRNSFYATDSEAAALLLSQEAEIERLRAEVAHWRVQTDHFISGLTAAEEEVENQRKAGAWCDKHTPNGGARSVCVICSGEKLMAALSRISYLCGEPNENGVSSYDWTCEEDSVVEAVERMRALVPSHVSANVSAGP